MVRIIELGDCLVLQEQDRYSHIKVGDIGKIFHIDPKEIGKSQWARLAVLHFQPKKNKHVFYEKAIKISRSKGSPDNMDSWREATPEEKKRVEQFLVESNI